GFSAVRLDPRSHTADHINCPACNEANVSLLEIDKDFSRLPFPCAAQFWMNLRQYGHLKSRTHETNANYINTLSRFFTMRLCDITAGHIREYQQARAANALNVGGQIIHPW